MELAATPSRSALVLRGVANIILGSVAVIWPGLTLYILILAFAINLLLVGIFAVFEPLFDRKNSHAILTVIMGILAIVVGIFLIGRPEIAAGVISLLIAFWALLFGISDLYVGFANAEAKARGVWLLILVGILSLIFGVYMLFNPVVGVLTLVWAIGIYGIASGLLLIIASFFMTKAKKKSRKK